MTENEKLRALLAEARELMGRNRLLLGEYEGPQELSKLTSRIDAALAEPVVDYEALYRTNVRCECGDDDACRLARERDEARAEVGAAHVQLGMSDIRHRLEASEIRRLLGSLSDALHERDKARAECASAYQRGAEAMREAAVKSISSRVDRFSERISVMQSAGMEASSSLFDCRDEADAVKTLIGALPIPEDKP